MAEPSEYSESGQPIYRYTTPKERPLQPAIGDSDNIEAIAKHIETYIGPPKNVFHELVSDLVHIDVHVVAPDPGQQRDHYTLVTSGMSERPMKVPKGAEELRFAELVIRVPQTWKLGQEELKDEANFWPIGWLKTLARFPHNFQTWLGPGHTIPNGDPAEAFAPNTKLCGMILVCSGMSPEAFHTLELSDRRVHFYSLVPLYNQEMDLKLKAGVGALQERLENLGGPAEYEVINPNRPNVCARRWWPF